MDSKEKTPEVSTKKSKKAKTNSELVGEALMGTENETENKPEISLNSNDVQGIDGWDVDGEYELKLKVKCIAKRKIKATDGVMPEGETPKESTPEEKGYDMVFEILGSETPNKEEDTNTQE